MYVESKWVACLDAGSNPASSTFFIFMTLKEIENFIYSVARSGISEMSMEIDGLKLSLKVFENYVSVLQIENQSIPAAFTGKSEEPISNYTAIKSPVDGAFCRRPASDKPPFVSLGEFVKLGDTVCIIEKANHKFDILSEVSGRVVRILPEDAEKIKQGQPLFLIDTSEIPEKRGEF